MRDYGPAIDIWSIGCIFAELLSMMKENVKNARDRRPLFPGKSCYPLSPDKKNTESRGGFPYSVDDQLSVIFKVIGTPNDEDKSFVANERALEYLNTFPAQEKTNLKNYYPHASPEALNLLSKMIIFNPYFRITIDEALAHPYFESVREPEFEKIAS